MNKNDNKNEHRNINVILKSTLRLQHTFSDINTAIYSSANS